MCVSRQEDESGSVTPSVVADSGPSRSPGVVKAKASSVIMNSLITSASTIMSSSLSDLDDIK